MADEIQVDDVAPPQDDPEGRSAALFGGRLGIPDDHVNVGVMQPSIAHALAAPADRPPRPWASMGARNIGGRIRTLTQDPNDALTLYAGSAQGGVFRTTDGGDTWHPLGLPEDAFPVGTIAVAPSNSKIVYVGSGERNAGPQSGLGFYRIDLGARHPRFVQEVGPSPAAGPGPNGAANSYSRIVVDPGNANRCWIASSTGLWRREPGPTFVREVLPVPPGANLDVTDVALAEVPGNPGRYRIYVGVARVGIFRGTFRSPPRTTTWDLFGAGTIQAAAGSANVVGYQYALSRVFAGRRCHLYLGVGDRSRPDRPEHRERHPADLDRSVSASRLRPGPPISAGNDPGPGGPVASGLPGRPSRPPLDRRQ